MTYDFDKTIDRKHTGSLKHDALRKMFGRDDLLPFWVADMDFPTPPFIVEALKKRLEHPVLGYTLEPDEYWPAVARWIKEHHGWDVERKWMTYIPGVVKGIGMAVNVFSQPGDKIIIQSPVYHPFRLVPQENGREVVFNPLIKHSDGSYEMDFGQLERIADERCKLFILANPHNPIGITWKKETLKRLADFCHERHIIVISDEIHCDLALFGNKHIPFASVSDKAAECSITFGAPTKTFNMAGVVSSYAIVPNGDIRQRFFSWLEANELNAPTMFAPIATIAAFTQGEAYRRELIAYIEGNIRFTEDYCRQYIPDVRPIRPQASYLVWLDCRALHLDHDSLIDLFVNKARLALNDGAMFGQEGEGFMRFNVGTQRKTIEQGLEQLRDAIAQLKM